MSLKDPYATARGSHNASHHSNNTSIVQCKYRQGRYNLAFPVTTAGIGLCFSSFFTYVAFQIQAIAYFVGHEPGASESSGCSVTALACLVPFAGSGQVNLTSYLLYLQAIIYAVSGILALFLSGYADRFKHQREQYIFWTVVYGVLCLPIAALRGLTLSTINALAGIYVVFGIVGFVSGTYMNCFIPYVMQQTHSDQLHEQTSSVQRKQITGMSISVWGLNGLYAGQMVPLIFVVGLTFAANVSDAGLYMTTACGTVCIVLTLAAWRFLPSPDKMTPTNGSKHDPLSAIKTFWRGIRQYPEAFKYLVAFTVYNDCLFSFAAVNAQLFNLQVRPSLREYSLYSLVQPITSIFSGTIFLQLYKYVPSNWNLTLKNWTTLCYVITMIGAIWVSVGISANSKIGMKHRWEFYAMSVLTSVANAIVSATFRVLFPLMFPVGDEVQYFSFQLALSCLTVWIPQVVNGPIVNATNNIRVPAVISAVLFLVAIAFSIWTNVDRGLQQSGNK